MGNIFFSSMKIYIAFGTVLGYCVPMTKKCLKFIGNLQYRRSNSNNRSPPGARVHLVLGKWAIENSVLHMVVKPSVPSCTEEPYTCICSYNQFQKQNRTPNCYLDIHITINTIKVMIILAPNNKYINFCLQMAKGTRKPLFVLISTILLTSGQVLV